MRTLKRDAPVWRQQVLTAPKFHFLRVSAQMRNLTKQKTEI